MAPWDMKGVMEKAASTGNRNLMVTERGFSFGYNNLVVDMKSFPTLRSFGFPVIFDITHSVQRPGGLGARLLDISLKELATFWHAQPVGLLRLGPQYRQ